MTNRAHEQEPRVSPASTTGEKGAGGAEPEQAGHFCQEPALACQVLDALETGLYVYRLEDSGDDRTLRLVAANLAACRFTGVAAAELVGKLIDECFPGLRNRGVPAALAGVVRDGTARNLADLYFGGGRLDGWFAVRAFPLPDNCVGVSFEAVSEKKKAENDLLRAKNTLEHIFNSSIPLCVTNRSFEIVQANRSYYEIFGELDRGERRKCYDSRPGRLCHTDSCPLRRIEAGEEVVVCETVKQQSDGERTFIVTGRPFLDEQGRVVGILESFLDVTEMKELERKLTRSRNMEALGDLAGGLAHDFNNLLAGMLGNIELAMLKMAPGGAVQSHLGTAVDLIGKARNLSNLLLTFARGGSPVKRRSDLGRLLRDISRFALDASYPCSLEIAPDLWTAEIDAEQIGRVVHNLLVNAREAMPTGGEIGLRAENVWVRDQEPVPLADGGYLRLSVSDQGAGISPEILPRIFDPYFSTKPKGADKGTGLGLAISHSIVSRHEGYITVESRLGRGTVFSVYLPAVASEGEVAAQQGVGAEVAVRALPRILLMDDDETILAVAGEMLALQGYEVAFARTGQEAIALCRMQSEAGQPFAAAVLDLTIRGGLGGLETLPQLLDIDPELKVVVMSGYADSPIMTDFSRYGFKGAIAKPFSSKSMAALLEGLL